MANERTCTLLVIESRKLRQAIFRSNPSPPQTQNHPTLTDLFRYIVSAFGLADCGKKNHSWRGKSDTSSTFNRNRLVMETPGRIWSARRGPGSYTAHVRRCTSVLLRPQAQRRTFTVIKAFPSETPTTRTGLWSMALYWYNGPCFECCAFLQTLVNRLNTTASGFAPDLIRRLCCQEGRRDPWYDCRNELVLNLGISFSTTE
jgi:hypothetical protein